MSATAHGAIVAGRLSGVVAAVGALAAVVTAGALAVTPAPAAAQAGARLEARVLDVEDGAVRFGYDARPEVEICDQGVRVGRSHMQWTTRRRGESASNCRSGYVEIELEMRDGRIRDIDLVHGLDESRPGTVDLGEVPAREAADFLLGLPYRDVVTGDAAEDALMPAMLADTGDVWPELLGLARDRDLSEDVRKSALFWLGQEAADAVAGELSDVALDDSEDQEVRNAAIFALSQRDDEESVPILMEIARTGEEPETRKTAMFWLAQSDDPRDDPILRGDPAGSKPLSGARRR